LISNACKKKGVLTHTHTHIYTCKFRDRAPASMTMSGDIFDKLLIFFRRPQPSLNSLFAAAPMAHLYSPLPSSADSTSYSCILQLAS